MSNGKFYIDTNVYEAAIERLEYIYDHFDDYIFSFSAGKDSSVMLQLAIEVAKRKNKLPVKALFIDLEAQYDFTIEHVTEMMLSDDVEGYWICLPLNLRNAVSVYQPQWRCWDPDEKEKWVRPMPEYDCVISDVDYFPFFFAGMEFEEFVIGFAEWFSKDKDGLIGCGVGIRSDESLNRYRTLKNERKVTYEGKMWTTKITEKVYNFYPIYDWRTEDVWTAVGRNNWKYNKIYDLMYLSGLSIHEARICQPFGDDQRKGLNLFRICEPGTWAKVVERVSGANFGNVYCKSYLMGHNKIILPKGHTWKSYAEFLLETIPKFLKHWYLEKFHVFEKWWEEKRSWPRSEWYDARPPKGSPLHIHNGVEHKQVPSWERIVKVILKNDYLCKGLSFGQTARAWDKFNEMKKIHGY